jgi:hypothetical protein
MTTDERSQTQTLIRKLKIHKAADFKSLYSNWVQVSASPFDISLVVGEATAPDQATVEVEQKVRIFFHPMEAKSIVAMLTQSLEDYEKQFGEIVTPRGQLQTAPEQEGIRDQNTEGV